MHGNPKIMAALDELLAPPIDWLETQFALLEKLGENHYHAQHLGPDEG